MLFDLSQGFVHGTARALRQPFVARRLDRENEHRSEQGSAAVDLAGPHHAPQGTAQAILSSLPALDPRLLLAVIHAERCQELEQHLFVAKRPGGPLQIAQRAAHLVG
jgi:hypothetical protein